MKMYIEYERLMDEVFGEDNFVALICLMQRRDWLLWKNSLDTVCDYFDLVFQKQRPVT